MHSALITVLQGVPALTMVNEIELNQSEWIYKYMSFKITNMVP